MMTPCRSTIEEHEWELVQTCSIMRFSFPASDSDSTVYKMENNATFQECDFTNAVKITEGGVLPSGAQFIDYVFEDDALDNRFYFASQIGCDQGQKIAVAVVEPYGKNYDEAFEEGQYSPRINACDCDHAIDDTMQADEASHTGFFDGCKSEMPDDLTCCPSGVDALGFFSGRPSYKGGDGYS